MAKPKAPSAKIIPFPKRGPMAGVPPAPANGGTFDEGFLAALRLVADLKRKGLLVGSLPAR